jgi:pyruvate/2-oxoglutarate dehydrogenase complex dihydrolipoamide acyltransferase (E2) component
MNGHKAQQVKSMPLSPAVRYLIDTHKLDPVNILATGPKDRILKSDVLKYMEDLKANKLNTSAAETASETTTVSYTDLPLSNMRRTIAKRLSASKRDIPYSYSVIECNINTLLELRNYFMQDKKLKITVNDLLVKSAAVALELVPECNAIWLSGEETIQYLPNIDVSVAVATAGGLITPIIKDTNRISISAISSQIKELAEKARLGKLQPHEYQGGTFW